MFFDTKYLVKLIVSDKGSLLGDSRTGERNTTL